MTVDVYNFQMDPIKKQGGRRNKRCVIFLAVTIVILILILLIAFSTKGFGAWEPGTCQTPKCVDASARIRRFMDMTADPCRDFYQYACGNFKNHHHIPHGDKSLDNLLILKDKQTHRIKRLLEEVQEDDPKYAIQAKTLYESCMNESKIEELGVKPLYYDFIMKYGGWTVLDKNLKVFERLEDHWVKLSLYSRYPGYYNRLFGVGVTGDHENKNHTIFLRQVDLVVDEEYLLDDEKLGAYMDLFNEISNGLGKFQHNYDVNYSKQEIVKLVQFEKDIAAISLDFNELYNKSETEVTTLGELNAKFSGNIDYKYAIKKLFGSAGIVVHDDEGVEIHGMAYFENLGDLVERTSLKTLTGYIMWRAVVSIISKYDFGPEINKLETELKRKLNDTLLDEPPRYEKCVELTKKAFGIEVTRMFVDEHFKGSLDGIHEITDRIKIAMSERVSSKPWLDEGTKLEILERIQKTESRIGFPDLVKDDEKMQNEIRRLGIGEMRMDKYFENVMELNRKGTRKLLRSLRKPLSSEWDAPVFDVNAFFSGIQNLMYLPVGILYPPFYDLNGVKSINYGAVGQVIGHEMTHGLHHFAEGEKSNSSLSEESSRIFEEKSKCIENAYNNITVEQLGINVNGTKTLTENVADLGGMAYAFQAYQSWVREHGPEKNLAGLDLSPNQMFFLGFTQICCSLYTDEDLEKVVEKKGHTPFRERTLGALYNNDDFATAYQCKPGSRMNPKEKCSLW